MRHVDRHAYGPLTTKDRGREFHKPRSKSGRDRVKRWAKRVLKQQAEVQSRDE